MEEEEKRPYLTFHEERMYSPSEGGELVRSIWVLLRN